MRRSNNNTEERGEKKIEMMETTCRMVDGGDAASD
jgi:hypothetical protein